MTRRDPVRMAMVGGGPGAFIGPVHKMAAELDGKLQLVAGVFSRNHDANRAAGSAWGLDPTRIYTDFETMIAAEATRTDGAELIAIATPNATHFAIAKAALSAGLNVMSDKPATATLEEALLLRDIVRNSRGLYALTFTFAGYPLIRRARGLVAEGAIGRVRKIVVEYSQGWLWRPIEREGERQAEWRTDPLQAGQGGCIADIGVHAFHLAEYVSGEMVTRICADLNSMVPGRQLDDDCNMLLHFQNGAVGVLHASQIATGARNGLALRIWGDIGGITWRHEACEELILDRPGVPSEIWHAGEPYAASGPSRLPSGHPQGFIEAFADLYGDMADAIRTGGRPAFAPGIDDGLRSMAFIDRSITSSRSGSWVLLDVESIG